MTVMQWTFIYVLTGAMLSIPWAYQFLKYTSKKENRNDFIIEYQEVMAALDAHENVFEAKATYLFLFSAVFTVTSLFWPLVMGMYGKPRI